MWYRLVGIPGTFVIFYMRYIIVSMETITLPYALVIVAVIYIIYRSLFGCPFGCDAIFGDEGFQSQIGQFRGREYTAIMAGITPGMYPRYEIVEP